MKKKKYVPQAGDVCRWNEMEVLIISPIIAYDNTKEYLAYDAQSFELDDLIFPCHINDLKLIYRP